MSTAVDALLVVPDGIRHTGFTRFAFERVVTPFAVAGANRMDRREINDIEAHRLGVIDTRQALAECRTRVRLALRRAGKKLIPSRKGSPLAINPHRMERLCDGGQRPVGINTHQSTERGIMREVMGLLRIGNPHRGSTFFQSLAVRSLSSAGGCRFDEGSTFQNLALQITKSGSEFFLQLVLPGKKYIPPRLDRVFPRALGGDAESGRPPVVRHRAHRRFVPHIVTHAPPLQERRHLVMPLLENIRLDRDLAAHRALDGKTGIVQ